ncbi:MAG TPA: hypothetical protein VHM91_11140, partial [Verrucomicrobiales bacterium]|nr:hypothetical protein [Verrucomicrobiales bacterium]
TVCERRGLLALILCFLPLGIGASSQLWSALAPEWHTSDDQVATVTGLLGGAVSAAGCLVGGFICDRRNRQASYVWFGIFVALSGIAMALLPRTPAMFTLCTLLFSFTTGLSWTGYTAFVLEAIGKGAAATKFSACASLANAPIAYMNSFNGFTQTQWGTKAMLLIEAAMGALGAVLFIVSTKWLLARGTSGEPVQTTLPRENLEPQPELSAAEVRIDPNE